MDERILPGILTLLIVAVAFSLMWWGWRNKLKRQADVGGLPEVPAELGEALISVPGQYVVTTSGGDWLDRLAVHGLGIRTTAVVRAYPAGILVERSGAQDIFIAKENFTEVATQAGMAGKFVEKDGIIVISWLLAGTAVDTGFRTTEAGAKRPLVETLQTLLPEGAKMAEGDLAENHEAAAGFAADAKPEPKPESQPESQSDVDPDVQNIDTPAVERNGKNKSE